MSSRLNEAQLVAQDRKCIQGEVVDVRAAGNENDVVITLRTPGKRGIVVPVSLERNQLDGRVVRKGERVTVWHTFDAVRGISLGGWVASYESEADYRGEINVIFEERKIRQWNEEKAGFDDPTNAKLRGELFDRLPLPFQQRINTLRRADADFLIHRESSELAALGIAAELMRYWQLQDVKVKDYGSVNTAVSPSTGRTSAWALAMATECAAHPSIGRSFGMSPNATRAATTFGKRDSVIDAWHGYLYEFQRESIEQWFQDVTGPAVRGPFDGVQGPGKDEIVDFAIRCLLNDPSVLTAESWATSRNFRPLDLVNAPAIGFEGLGSQQT